MAYSPRAGVREDATDIILNLKNLIRKLHGESGQVQRMARRWSACPTHRQRPPTSRS